MRTCKHIPMILALSSGLLLTSCTSHMQHRDDTESGLTVSQIYHESTREDAMYAAVPHYRMQKVNATPQLVKTLDNPSIPLFVYPHVALIGDEQILKPGYTTAFFLYKQNQFALASEQY